MPVEQMNLNKVPKSQRTSKVTASDEWRMIVSLLPKLPPTDALVISLGPETLGEFKNKDLKIALAAFRQKLRAEFARQGFRISVVGDQIVVKHQVLKLDKPDKKPKGNK